MDVVILVTIIYRIKNTVSLIKQINFNRVCMLFVKHLFGKEQDNLKLAANFKTFFIRQIRFLLNECYLRSLKQGATRVDLTNQLIITAINPLHFHILRIIFLAIKVREILHLHTYNSRPAWLSWPSLNLCGSLANRSSYFLFLVAKLLYNYLCPSVRLSVRFRGKRDFLGP